MTGNISKTKGFTGPRGDIGPKGDKGDTGDFSNVRLNYNEETGELSYQTELVQSTTTAPYIGKNGNWYAFDGIRKKYVDTGVNAQGGVSDEYIKEYLDKKTAVLKTDVEGLQKRINEEAHFRGYLSTNAKIQALEATPNDFAYSAESNTKWVYDAENGWQNTGVAVPDQLTPASETTPLINGVASVGEEEAYARGDHRHPTDTTRASVKELNDLRDDMQTALESVETVYVNVTKTIVVGGYVLEADKTFEEIKTALDDNKNVYIKSTIEEVTILGAVHRYTDNSLSACWFEPLGYAGYRITIESDNTITIGEIGLIDTIIGNENVVDAPPTVNAVVEYVASAIGEALEGDY